MHSPDGNGNAGTLQATERPLAEAPIRDTASGAAKRL